MGERPAERDRGTGGQVAGEPASSNREREPQQACFVGPLGAPSPAFQRGQAEQAAQFLIGGAPAGPPGRPAAAGTHSAMCMHPGQVASQRAGVAISVPERDLEAGRALRRRAEGKWLRPPANRWQVAGAGRPEPSLRGPLHTAPADCPAPHPPDRASGVAKLQPHQAGARPRSASSVAAGHLDTYPRIVFHTLAPRVPGCSSSLAAALPQPTQCSAVLQGGARRHVAFAAAKNWSGTHRPPACATTPRENNTTDKIHRLQAAAKARCATHTVCAHAGVAQLLPQGMQVMTRSLARPRASLCGKVGVERQHALVLEAVAVRRHVLALPPLRLPHHNDGLHRRRGGGQRSQQALQQAVETQEPAE